VASIERRIAALEGLIPPPAPPKEEADESAAREGEGRARLRAAFEEEYGSIEMIGRIVAPDYQGGWVDE
jgi:hypothetical protein